MRHLKRRQGAFWNRITIKLNESNSISMQGFSLLANVTDISMNLCFESKYLNGYERMQYVDWMIVFFKLPTKKMKLKLLFKDWHSSKIFQISPHFNQTILKRLRIFVVSILMLPAKWCRPKCECVTSATLLPPIWWLLFETVKTPEKRPKNDWYMSCAVWIPFFLFTYIDSFMQLSCVYICASQ